MTQATLPLAFAQGTGGAAMLQLVPFLLIGLVFYFLLIAPVRKRQKALQNLIANLEKGDRVVTTGGLYGEVAGVHERDLVLRIADHVNVRVAKSAIAGLEGDEDAGGSR